MKKILVTGGAGFIGANFLHYIMSNNEECSVKNIDKLSYASNLSNLKSLEVNENYSFFQVDICDKDEIFNIFESEEITDVIHFAAESHVDNSILNPSDFIQTNIIGTFNLLEAARHFWKDNDHKFIHISTDEVYGSLGDYDSFTEETTYAPRSPYSASKASSDHLVSSYYHTYNLPTIITNCSNNYGPFQHTEKLIPLVITNAVNGVDLPVYGKGDNIRDWLFVQDHCSAILKVFNNGVAGQKYNIGGNNEVKNIDVVSLICNILDKKLGLLNDKPRTNLIKFVKDRAGHDYRYAIDASKITNQLDWKPSVNFEEGLDITIDWYLKEMGVL